MYNNTYERKLRRNRHSSRSGVEVAIPLRLVLILVLQVWEYHKYIGDKHQVVEMGRFVLAVSFANVATQ